MIKINILMAEGFLQNIGQSTTLEETISTIGKNYGVDTDALLKEKGDLIKLFHTMLDEFPKEMGDKMEDTRYYFAHPDEDNKCEPLYHLILLLESFDLYHVETAAELEDQLMSLSEETFLQKYAEALYSYNNYYIKNDADIPDSLDSVAIIRFIVSSDFPPEVKLKLQDLYLNRHTHIQRLCSIFDDTIRFLQKYEKELAIQIDQFYHYWNTLKKDRTFHRFMVEEFSILSQIEEHPAGYLLIPSLHLFVFSLSTPTKDEGEAYLHPAILNLGLLFGEALSINLMTNPSAETLKADVVIEALKLLSDKSRFEIMKYIHDKEAYGNEIAEHLNLTTATVSHHMGVLLSAGLVHIERRDGKMYYSINHEIMKHYLDFLEQKLL